MAKHQYEAALTVFRSELPPATDPAEKRARDIIKPKIEMLVSHRRGLIEHFTKVGISRPIYTESTNLRGDYGGSINKGGITITKPDGKKRTLTWKELGTPIICELTRDMIAAETDSAKVARLKLQLGLFMTFAAGDNAGIALMREAAQADPGLARKAEGFLQSAQP